jgi:hypothetical protein
VVQTFDEVPRQGLSLGQIRMWSAVCDTFLYSTFAISTLLYVGQLEPLPQEAIDKESVALRIMFPGPGMWAVPNDLWYLREHYGLSRSAQSLQMSVRAAQLRVACLGCHFEHDRLSTRQFLEKAQDSIYSRSRALKDAIYRTGYEQRPLSWARWYKGCHCCVLVENVLVLQSAGIQQQHVLSEIAGESMDQWTDQDLAKTVNTFQKVVGKHLKAKMAPCPIDRIRKKVSRWWNVPWGLTGVPAKGARLIHRHLIELGSQVPPRVQAAVFRTLWNSWVTERRFQRRRSVKNVCVFKCSITAEDSLEHYCRCPVVLRVGRSSLRIDYPPPGGPEHLDSQLLLGPTRGYYV